MENEKNKFNVSDQQTFMGTDGKWQLEPGTKYPHISSQWDLKPGGCGVWVGNGRGGQG